MTTSSPLPTPALNAARAALNAALNDPANQSPTDTNGASLEDGEIQELDMAAHAGDIRTVFSDPKNFNVKVSPFLSRLSLLSF